MTQGHPLKTFREKHSPVMSQTDLARLLGVSRGYVLRLENGERQPGLKLLPVIEEKTGIPPKKLRPDLAEALEGAE